MSSKQGMTPEYPHTKSKTDWQYGYEAGRRAALEEAARVAEERIVIPGDDVAEDIAAAIRALKSPVSEDGK